jgi:hypothetical protein
VFQYTGDRTLNPTTGAVHFRVENGGLRAVWRVSEEALQDHCNARSDYAEAFDGFANTVMEVANEKYERGEVEPDGTVFVRTSDL